MYVCMLSSAFDSFMHSTLSVTSLLLVIPLSTLAMLECFDFVVECRSPFDSTCVCRLACLLAYLLACMRCLSRGMIP